MVQENVVVDIKGKMYSVQFVDELPGSYGCSDSEHQKITVERQSDEVIVFRSIVHELLHCYLNECGLSSYSNDETLISWLDYHFLEIYKKCNEIFRQ